MRALRREPALAGISGLLLRGRSQNRTVNSPPRRTGIVCVGAAAGSDTADAVGRHCASNGDRSVCTTAMGRMIPGEDELGAVIAAVGP